MRQHVSGILNNDLHSSHALFTAKYIEQAKEEVCADLRTLISKVAPGFYSFMKKDKLASQVLPELFLLQVRVLVKEAHTCAAFRRRRAGR